MLKEEIEAWKLKANKLAHTCKSLALTVKNQKLSSPEKRKLEDQRIEERKRREAEEEAQQRAEVGLSPPFFVYH